MTTHPQLLTHRIRLQDHGDKSTFARQWRLLEQLSSAFKGLTIKEMVVHSGVSEKTVRRDLALFTKLGFNVVETVEKFGLKVWRIGQPLKAPQDRHERYSLIRDLIRELRAHAMDMGDVFLAADLVAIESKVARKCQEKKPKPR